MARAVAGYSSRCLALFGARPRPAGVLGQRHEQPQLADVGAGKVLLAGVPGIGEHGPQPGPDLGLGQLVPALIQKRVEQGAAGRDAGTASRRR
jgi:hypothetical protein